MIPAFPFSSESTISRSFDLGRCARRPAYACDITEAATVHAPADSAHPRAERQDNARLPLAAPDADPDDLPPKTRPAP